MLYRGEPLYMIKVIKYGKKRRALCEHCESLLEFEKEDIKTVQTGMNEWEKQITCPVCDTPVSVEEKQIRNEVSV